MTEQTWIKEFPGAITVCDPEGIILEMNEKAIKSFQSQGGEKLIGTNLMDCHPKPAREKLKGLMEKRKSNVYTIEKKGSHRLVYQSPWYREGKYAGFVEMVLTIPEDVCILFGKDDRLMKNNHLRRCPRPSSFQRTHKYALLLRTSGALHLNVFDQPVKHAFSNNRLF